MFIQKNDFLREYDFDFIIVSVRVNQKSSAVPYFDKLTLIKRQWKVAQHWTTGFFLRTGEKQPRSDLVCFKREREQSSPFFLWTHVLFLLRRSQKGCWDITCGRVRETAEHATLNNTPPWEQAAVFHAIVATWAAVNGGTSPRMPTCSSLLGWTRITWTSLR